MWLGKDACTVCQVLFSEALVFKQLGMYAVCLYLDSNRNLKFQVSATPVVTPDRQTLWDSNPRHGDGTHPSGGQRGCWPGWRRAVPWSAAGRRRKSTAAVLAEPASSTAPHGEWSAGCLYRHLQDRRTRYCYIYNTSHHVRSHMSHIRPLFYWEFKLLPDILVYRLVYYLLKLIRRADVSADSQHAAVKLLLCKHTTNSNHLAQHSYSLYELQDMSGWLSEEGEDRNTTSTFSTIESSFINHLFLAFIWKKKELQLRFEPW